MAREIRGQGTRRTKQDRAEQLKHYPAGMALCRITHRHAIDPNDWPELNKVPSGWVMVWTCPMCELDITVWYDHDGFRDRDRKPTRKYAPGYLMEEGGKLRDDETAELFMKLVGTRERR